MALDLPPARRGGGARGDPEATLPLARGVAPLEIEGSAAAPPPAPGTRAPRAAGAAAAAALVAALLALCAASEGAGWRCAAENLHGGWWGVQMWSARAPESDCADSWRCVWDPAGCGGTWEPPPWLFYVWDPARGRWRWDLHGCRDLYRVSYPSRWRHAALWGPAVALPYAALAAWCVWMRGGFQAGRPLHLWTGRYGAGAGVAAALFASRPWSVGCLGYDPQVYLVMTVLCALKVVSQVLVAHKLEELRCWRLAWAVRATSVAGLLCMTLGAVFLYGHVGNKLMNGINMGDDIAIGTTILLAALCYLLTCVFGLWGLLGAVARAPLCGGGARGRAACFVRLTAASLAVSCASTVVMVRYSLFSIGVIHFSNGMSAADALIDSLTVAIFSGLVGPASVRVLARDAFSAINSYTDDQLQAFYEKYLEYLDRAQVRWVRCGYLRHLAAAGAVMTRCQEVPADQVFVGSSGFPLVRNGPKQRFVLSHPWLSKEHPDPTGDKLRLLVQQLDVLQASDDDAVFVDYMSLPQNDKLNQELQRLEHEKGETPEPGQHPAVRTEAEEVQFKQALSAMEQIYSIGKTPVIVLPMDSIVETGREYISRGWCLLEFCLAISFENVANAEMYEPVRSLMERMKVMKGDTVDGFREAFKTTHFTNKGDADVVLKLFENTLNLGSSH